MSDPAIVPHGKIEVYPRGRVYRPDNLEEEYRALQRMKQTQRRAYDADPTNERRLEQLKRLRHNVERSNSMAKVLEDAGIPDTPQNNRMMMEHLLEQGDDAVATGTTRSVFTHPGGGQVVIQGKWTVIDDGRAYLATVMIMPVRG